MFVKTYRFNFFRLIHVTERLLGGEKINLCVLRDNLNYFFPPFGSLATSRKINMSKRAQETNTHYTVRWGCLETAIYLLRITDNCVSHCTMTHHITSHYRGLKIWAGNWTLERKIHKLIKIYTFLFLALGVSTFFGRVYSFYEMKGWSKIKATWTDAKAARGCQWRRGFTILNKLLLWENGLSFNETTAHRLIFNTFVLKNTFNSFLWYPQNHMHNLRGRPFVVVSEIIEDVIECTHSIP